MKRTLAIMAITVGAAWPAAAAAQEPGEYVSPTSAARVQGVQVARTGQDSMEMVVLGGGLAAAGAVLVVGARRRRAHAAA